MALPGRWLLLIDPVPLTRGRIGWLRVFALALFASANSPAPTSGGTWTQPPGHLYLKLSYATLESSTRLDDSGSPTGLEASNQPARGTEYRVREIRVYGEYGVAPRLTLYGSSAYKRTRLLEPLLIVSSRVFPAVTHETNGLGDIHLGVRVRVLDGGAPMSVAGEVKIPSGYTVAANPSLGNGEADVTLRGLVGASAGWIYYTADAGWTHRGGRFSDEAGASFELGGRVDNYYSWRGVLRGVRSLGGSLAPLGDALFDPAITSPRSLTLDFAVGAEFLTGIDLEASISHVLSGRNTLAGNTLEAGLVWALGGR